MPDSILVRAGRHTREHCPIRVAWPGDTAPVALACGGSTVPAQRDGGDLVFVAARVEAGQEAQYTPADAAAGEGVRVVDTGTEIDVTLDGEPLTSYRYAGVPARPYFWPVLAPGGVPVTRAWPMAEVAGETRDHKHHRSMYVAFGAVNGVDNWSEEEGHGHTRHGSVDEVVSGPVFGRFATTSDWTDAGGGPLLTQKLAATFWRGSAGLRMMDVDVRLLATAGDVLFGDTKEGGILTFRVATSMDVPRGGRIENAYGGIDEGETWGRAAHWCDYSGTVEGRSVGVAVMDHPVSFRWPTYWHVRDYGLMGANPFALHDYTGGQKEGSYRLGAGLEMRFLYRVVLHTGDAASADIRARYLDFVSPPTAEAR